MKCKGVCYAQHLLQSDINDFLFALSIMMHNAVVDCMYFGGLLIPEFFYRLWKGYTCWKNNVRFQKNVSSRWWNWLDKINMLWKGCDYLSQTLWYIWQYPSSKMGHWQHNIDINVEYGKTNHNNIIKGAVSRNSPN